MKKVLLIFGLFMSIICFAEEKVDHRDLNIKVLNFEGNKGNAKLLLFKTRKGFPNKEKYAVKIEIVEIVDGKATFAIKDLNYGEYGILVFHDENENGKLDLNFLGIPKEGFAYSNGVKGHAKFHRVKFVFDSKNNEVLIHLHNH